MRSQKKKDIEELLSTYWPACCTSHFHDILISAWDAPCFLLDINLAFECLQFIFWCFLFYWKGKAIGEHDWTNTISCCQHRNYSSILLIRFYYYNRAEWSFLDLLKPKIFAAIMNIYSFGRQLFLDSSPTASMDTAVLEVSHLNLI